MRRGYPVLGFCLEVGPQHDIPEKTRQARQSSEPGPPSFICRFRFVYQHMSRHLRSPHAIGPGPSSQILPFNRAGPTQHIACDTHDIPAHSTRRYIPLPTHIIHLHAPDRKIGFLSFWLFRWAYGLMAHYALRSRPCWTGFGRCRCTTSVGFWDSVHTLPQQARER